MMTTYQLPSHRIPTTKLLHTASKVIASACTTSGVQASRKNRHPTEPAPLRHHAFTCFHRTSDARPKSKSLHTAAAYSSSGPGYNGASSSSRFMCQGPNRCYDLNPITLRVGTNEEGQPVTAQLQIYAPLGRSSCPLVIISPGFLLDGSMYRSYAQELATWGYVAVLYDLSEFRDDQRTVAALRTIMDACAEAPEVKPYLDPGTVLLVGHSRGAKVSVLAAAVDARVKALALLDPVNNTAMTPTGPGFPSALPLLGRATVAPRHLPVLIVGAAQNGDVVPEDASYRRFLDVCSGPTWLVDLQAGHLQFLDKQTSLFSMFSAAGPTPDAAVRAVSKAAIVCWLEGLMRPGSGASPRQALQQQLEAEAAAFRAMAPGTKCHYRGLEMLSSTAAAGSSSSSAASGSSSRASSSSSSSGGNGTAASSGGSRQREAAVRASFDELMAMRASALKRMLVDRGVPCQDCFDKESLARRVLEKCSV